MILQVVGDFPQRAVNALFTLAEPGDRTARLEAFLSPGLPLTGNFVTVQNDCVVAYLRDGALTGRFVLATGISQLRWVRHWDVRRTVIFNWDSFLSLARNSLSVGAGSTDLGSDDDSEDEVVSRESASDRVKREVENQAAVAKSGLKRVVNDMAGSRLRSRGSIPGFSKKEVSIDLSFEVPTKEAIRGLRWLGPAAFVILAAIKARVVNNTDVNRYGAAGKAGEVVAVWDTAPPVATFPMVTVWESAVLNTSLPRDGAMFPLSMNKYLRSQLIAYMKYVRDPARRYVQALLSQPAMEPGMRVSYAIRHVYQATWGLKKLPNNMLIGRLFTAHGNVVFAKELKPVLPSKGEPPCLVGPINVDAPLGPIVPIGAFSPRSIGFLDGIRAIKDSLPVIGSSEWNFRAASLTALKADGAQQSELVDGWCYIVGLRPVGRYYKLGLYATCMSGIRSPRFNIKLALKGR